MRVYKVNGIAHKVFDPDDTIPSDLTVKSDWRSAVVGDWVKSDDGCVIEVLRQGIMKRTKGKERNVKYIGTCTGTYLCRNKDKMDTERRENIYSFSAKSSSNTSKRIKDRDYLTANEAAFAKLIANGFSPEIAYKRAYGTENTKYAKMKSAVLVKQERIVSAVKEELDEVLKAEGIDLKYLIKGVKLEVENASKAGDRLRAMSMLWDAAEVIPKQKVTQVTGAVFQGFDDNMIESAKRPQIKGEVNNEISKK